MASSSASRTQPSNGRSLPDVVVAFQDGQTYSKTKLEEHLRAGFFERQPPKPAAKSTAKKDDVDYIVSDSWGCAWGLDCPALVLIYHTNS